MSKEIDKTLRKMAIETLTHEINEMTEEYDNIMKLLDSDDEFKYSKATGSMLPMIKHFIFVMSYVRDITRVIE